MIALQSDCLLFELATGESVPLSASMISFELESDATGRFDPEILQHAAASVFHYFKHDLGRDTVTVGEFAQTLETVLRKLGFKMRVPESADAGDVSVADLRQLAGESGDNFELFFFPRLRDELRNHLRQSPRLVRFRGLRGCVKQLTGARRWSARCEKLQEQIVAYLRHCLTTETDQAGCALVVE